MALMQPILLEHGEDDYEMPSDASNSSHSPSLHRTLLALGFFAASSSSMSARVPELYETQRLLLELESCLNTAAVKSDIDSTVHCIVREVDSMMAALGNLSGASAHCDEAAVLYLSTNANLENDDNGSITLQIGGNWGRHGFAFASGTTQAHIIDAVNSLSESIGVVAEQSAANWERIQLRSIVAGADGFVEVRLVRAEFPLVFHVPTGGSGAFSATDAGQDGLAGDVDCDRWVNIVDLMLGIQSWGECPLPPFECFADVSGDGLVNVNDLLRVINNWGASDP